MIGRQVTNSIKLHMVLLLLIEEIIITPPIKLSQLASSAQLSVARLGYASYMGSSIISAVSLWRTALQLDKVTFVQP